MSKLLKGRIFSSIHRDKLSKAGTGRIFSNEHKRKISDAAKKRWDLFHNQNNNQNNQKK
jgi:hypothetical protein